MPIEPVFEKINLSRQCEKVSGQIKAECKTDVSTDSVEKVLSSSAFAVISQSQIVNGQVRYGGKVTFYLSYLGSDGEVYKCECGSEFVGGLEKPCAPDGSRVKTDVVVDKIEISVDGIKLSTTAFLTVTATPYEKCEVCALCGGENLIVDSKEVPIVKSFGVKQGVFPVEEEFELGYPVQEVLFHRANAIITAVQCGVGSIIIDGEVLLSVIALQKTEKKDIIRENKVLPFRFELECEDAMPAMQATARVKERSLKTDVTVDTENGTSVLSVSASLIFDGEAFTVSDLTVVSDAFSTDEQIELVVDEFPYQKACEQYGASHIGSSRCAVDELPVGAVIYAVGGERAEILSLNKTDCAIEVSGSLNAVAFFRDGDGKVFTRRVETPFEKKIDLMCGVDDNVDVECVAVKSSAKIVSLAEIDLDYQVMFTVYPCEKGSIKYVKQVKSLGEKKKADCAISVFIPMEGEDLWSLAKRLNTCPDTLLATNKELQFPLTGKERIIIYRQK